ncbi:hypothetical protein E2C01_013367 [Portunus trituberculatus]|uniref:Uncharacterized protein n=1 Tax=Portunus trituberculatus TaxID=210409 RepID=A0A5B7DGU5_PORTR|nr:hypothetical protein [Portunus trituberculatus]
MSEFKMSDLVITAEESKTANGKARNEGKRRKWLTLFRRDYWGNLSDKSTFFPPVEAYIRRANYGNSAVRRSEAERELILAEIN